MNKKWSFTPDNDMAPGGHDIVVKSGAGNKSFPTHMTIIGEVTNDHVATDTVNDLSLHDSHVLMNLFEESEINSATHKYELMIDNNDLQQGITQSGTSGQSLMLTEQDLHQLLNDLHV